MIFFNQYGKGCDKMYMIVIAGMPASGKSTLAAAISKELGLPIIAKDKLKESLFDVLGFENYQQKRNLDHAANALLISVSESMILSDTPVILDNNFDSISAETFNDLCDKYDCNCITLMLGGETEAFYQRYVERDRMHLRHLGHILQEHYPPHPEDSLDHEMTREEFDEKFIKRGMTEFKCRGVRIDIDATHPEKIDTTALLAQIHTLIK